MQGRYRFSVGHEIAHWRLHRSYVTKDASQHRVREEWKDCLGRTRPLLRSDLQPNGVRDYPAGGMPSVTGVLASEVTPRARLPQGDRLLARIRHERLRADLTRIAISRASLSASKNRRHADPRTQAATRDDRW